nr:ankyrin repeat domain-containing protein [Tatlockia sp.]
GRVVKELFLETGGHQIIKNDGIKEIKDKVFKTMELFFNNPEKIVIEDWSHLKYDDVFAEHSLFLEDQDFYFRSRFTQRSHPSDDFSPRPQIDEVVSIQKQVRGFLDRKKYAITNLPNEKLTGYPAFAIGNDPEIVSLKKYQQPGRIAILSTSGLRAITIASQLKNQKETMTLEQTIDKAKVPLIIIMDNSKSVYQFWKNLQTFMLDVSKSATRDLCLANLSLFLEESKELYRLTGFLFFAPRKAEQKELYNHFSSLFFKYGYEYIRTMICNALLFRQSLTDTDSFIKLKNILSYREIEHVYVHPSNLIGLIPSLEDRKKILSNIKRLEPVVSIHSSFCKTHDIPEKILFFSQQNEETTLQDTTFPLCYSDIAADSVIQFINDYNHPSPLQLYQYLTGLKHTPEWRYDINESNSNGKNALLAAAQTGNINLLLAFIKMGAYVNHRDKNFNSALTLALKNNHLELVKILIENGYRLDHPFDKSFIKASSGEIRNYLETHLESVKYHEAVPTEKVLNFLGLKIKQVQEAIFVIKNATNFPQSCEAELSFLESTVESEILGNCYETTQWLLSSNLICLSRLTKGTHKSGWNQNSDLKCHTLMGRKIEMFKVLIEYGDSLKCIDPGGMDFSESRFKPKPLAIILKCRQEVAEFLNQIQDDRFSKLKQDLGLEEIEEFEEDDRNNDGCSMQ